MTAFLPVLWHGRRDHQFRNMPTEIAMLKRYEVRENAILSPLRLELAPAISNAVIEDISFRISVASDSPSVL